MNAINAINVRLADYDRQISELELKRTELRSLLAELDTSHIDRHVTPSTRTKHVKKTKTKAPIRRRTIDTLALVTPRQTFDNRLEDTTVAPAAFTQRRPGKDWYLLVENFNCAFTAASDVAAACNISAGSMYNHITPDESDNRFGTFRNLRMRWVKARHDVAVTDTASGITYETIESAAQESATSVANVLDSLMTGKSTDGHTFCVADC